MTHENENEQPEAGKAGARILDHYDVEKAITAVRKLAEGLIPATAHTKHRFRQEWLEQLIQRYRERPGKPIIHLDDLDDEVIPTLAPEARSLLFPHWRQLVERFGYMPSMNRFRCLRDIAVAKKTTQWSRLGTWRNLERTTGLRINQLEPFVTAVRASSAGTTRFVRNPKLPFNIASQSGAKIIGYRGDTAHDTSAFNNMDTLLHEDYKRAILETVGEVPFTTTTRSDGYIRTNVGTLITILTSKAGLDNSVRQKIARNPLPSWLFVTTDDVVVSALRAMYDAEGSPTVHSIQLTQTVWRSITDTPETVPSWPRKLTVSSLEPDAQEAICHYPSLALVSVSLLLHRMGIRSFIAPSKISTTKHGTSVYWNLAIYRTRNMRRYEEKIGFLSPIKQNKLHHYNSLHRPHRPSSLPPSFSAALKKTS